MLASNIPAQVLLTVNEPTGAASANGSAKTIRGVPNDDVPASAQTFKFWAKTQFNGGSGSGPAPTGQVKVQGSFDGGVSWMDIATGASQASDDVVRAEQLSEVANVAMPPLVRALSGLAAGGSGGTAPTKQVVTVYVTSNADFTVA